MIKNLWENLDPNKKRLVAIIGGVAGLVAVVSLFSGNTIESNKPQTRSETIRHVLTDTNTREVGMDALSADLKTLSRDNDQLRRELERLQRQLERAEEDRRATNELSQTVRRLQTDLERLSKKNEELADRVRQSGGATREKIDAGEETSSSQLTVEKLNLEDPVEFFERAPLPKQPQPSAGERTTIRSGEAGENPQQKGLQIVSHVQADADSGEEAPSDDDDGMFLPAGSILTGVLLNGLDAPTAQGARRDPFPATLRIQKEAILPNRFRADVRECFFIISGYGDLSSERAYLRGETISCVREDGGVVESRLDAYAVGEDGKAGVRGRLVSKQGQIIAKSLIAGFASGVAEAFDVDPVPVINTRPGSRIEYQEVFSQDLMRGAAVKGASKALDRIAEFYIEMAENLFPVIEIDAGRQIDVVITRGTKLQIR